MWRRGLPLRRLRKEVQPWWRCRRPARPFVGLHGMAHRLSNYQGVQRTVLHRGAHQCSMMQHGHVSKAHCRVEWRPRTRRWFPRKDRPLRGLPTKTPQSCPSLGAENFCSNEDESLGSDAQSTLGLIALQNCVQHNTLYMRWGVAQCGVARQCCAARGCAMRQCIELCGEV